eukprot:119135_1
MKSRKSITVKMKSLWNALSSTQSSGESEDFDVHQRLTIDQYPRYIDLICDFLNLHKRLDDLTNKKFPIKKRLQEEELDSAEKTKLKREHENLKKEASRTSELLFSILETLGEEFPQASLSHVAEIQIPLDCPEPQLRKDFQRETFVICGIKFLPSAESQFGFDFIRLCTRAAVEREWGISGRVLDSVVSKTLCAASRTDIGGIAYVQMMEYDLETSRSKSNRWRSDSTRETFVPEPLSALISKGDTPPTTIDVTPHQITVTVVSHLYKTDPNVVSPYDTQDLGEADQTSMSTTPNCSPNRSELALDWVAVPRPAACHRSSLEDSSISPNSKRKSLRKSDSSRQSENEVEPEWLSNFQQFMPVMTRTVIKFARSSESSSLSGSPLPDDNAEIQFPSSLSPESNGVSKVAMCNGNVAENSTLIEEKHSPVVSECDENVRIDSDNVSVSTTLMFSTVRNVQTQPIRCKSLR